MVISEFISLNRVNRFVALSLSECMWCELSHHIFYSETITDQSSCLNIKHTNHTQFRI